MRMRATGRRRFRPFKERSLLFEPGTSIVIRATAGSCVSAAIEAVADEPFVAFMRKQVFEPLRMEDTSARLHDAADSRSRDPILPAVLGGSRYGLHLMRPIDYSCYAGSSGSCQLRPIWCASEWRSGRRLGGKSAPTVASC